MKVTRLALFLSLPFLFFAAANAATITFTNKCPFTVWPATLTGSQNPKLSKTGFVLPTGASNSVNVRSPWSGPFWARTGCSSNSGKFSCATGDCASDQVQCNGAGGIPPATLAELTVAPNGGQDFYDTSNVDGFNAPMSIVPQGRNGDCKLASCPANINTTCPTVLQMKGPNGNVVPCKSACLGFNQDQYCCRGGFNKPKKCRPSYYSQSFKQQCPDAYSYAYDDKSSTLHASAGPATPSRSVLNHRMRLRYNWKIRTLLQ